MGGWIDACVYVFVACVRNACQYVFAYIKDSEHEESLECRAQCQHHPREPENRKSDPVVRRTAGGHDEGEVVQTSHSAYGDEGEEEVNRLLHDAEANHHLSLAAHAQCAT
jgi:hypothetical protein